MLNEVHRELSDSYYFYGDDYRAYYKTPYRVPESEPTGNGVST